MTLISLKILTKSLVLPHLSSVIKIIPNNLYFRINSHLKKIYQIVSFFKSGKEKIKGKKEYKLNKIILMMVEGEIVLLQTFVKLC